MRRDPDDYVDRWADKPIGDFVDRHLALLIFIALWVVGNSILMVWLHV
jgi:hypothetical protein